jgi:hypothetical protein
LDCHIYRKVLLMVQELHKLGFQKIRIAPGMSPSGMDWRCAVTPVINISSRHGAKIKSGVIPENLIARYTSANENAYFGWVDYSDEPPEHLADIFLRGHQELTSAGYGEDHEYVEWYQKMLDLTYPDQLPIAYADWPLSGDYMTTTSPIMNKDVKIPLPPVGPLRKKNYKKSMKQPNYYSMLVNGKIDNNDAVNKLLGKLREHMAIEPIPEDVIKKSHMGPKILDKLTRLPLYIARGLRSWGGLVIGFPGTKDQLSSEFVGTPYLRSILYPILDLYQRIQKYEENRLPCIYIIGERFPDVFLRKFRLLKEITPHVIILTKDLIGSKKHSVLPNFPEKFNEQWVQSYFCKEMVSDKGLNIPTVDGEVRAGLISYEVPTWEGTKNPERLDILGYDKSDHSLIAFEFKGPSANRVELENLFLQGLQHREWLEQNKMAIKLIFDGPLGEHINTRKRVRLMLGFFGKQIPELFHLLRDKHQSKDRHLQINFVEISLNNEKIQMNLVGNA